MEERNERYNPPGVILVTEIPVLVLIKYSWRHDTIAQTTCAHD